MENSKNNLRNLHFLAGIYLLKINNRNTGVKYVQS